MIRLLKWVLLCFVGLAAAFLAPVGYVELACRSDVRPNEYVAILAPEFHRSEARSLLTYPEWHIVHAYDDYARVISDGDPHEFGFLAAIGGFWTSLCSLSEASGDHGGFSAEFKQTIYTIGVSFTAEMLAKALYEESLGRIAAGLRGQHHAPLDILSAEQATRYSQFLRQVPWYRWDFTTDAQALSKTATGGWRDRERRVALGIEYRVKAAYARVITKAVANMKPDAQRLRMIVTGVSAQDMATLDSIEIIGPRETGLEIDTPRYRTLTHLMVDLANMGAEFVEIAGNDDIMLTAISDDPELDSAIYSFARQGYGDTRHLVLLGVADLAETLRRMNARNLRLEHVHDY